MDADCTPRPFVSRPARVAATGVDRFDAEELVREAVFAGRPVPAIVHVVEDVDIRSLDRSRVIPNMGDPSIRGVWFPARTGECETFQTFGTHVMRDVWNVRP